MLVVLPTIGAFFCRICDKMFDTVAAIAPNVGALVCRVLDGFVELFLWVDKKTIFRTKKVSDKIVEFAYLREDTQVEGIQRQITGSLSFSLLLFCLGMCGALVYMLFVIG